MTQKLIVHPPTKSLVLTGADPRVLSFIPHSKHLQYKGSDLTVIPHGLDETLMLRNLDIEAPSPILFHHEWTGSFTPYAHQKDTASFLTLHKRAFVFNGLGSGKTYSAIQSAEYLMATGHIRKVLVLCCLSTITPTWGKELFTHVMERKVNYLTGTAERRLKQLGEDADYYITNHDALRTGRLVEELVKRQDIDLVIVDEASMYRNSKSQKYKALLKVLANPQRRLWLMTATPCPRDPTDAWALARLVDPKRVPSYFTHWRDMTMRQLTQFKWVPKPEGLQLAFKAMQPAIRYKTEDCIDLPDRVFLSRRPALSDEQATAYSAMRKNLTVTIGSDAITAANAGVALMKLVQIACGVVRTGVDEETVSMDSQPRLDALFEIMEEVEEDAKVIVFAPFKAVLPMVAAALEAAGYSTAQVSGDTGKAARDKIFSEFQNLPEPRVIVAHPGCMSHGLTLTAANTTIWYAPVTNSETVEQANARTYRNGQKRKTRVVEIYATPEERRLYDIVRGRQEQSGTLMDLYRQVAAGVDLE